jgi:hypothetical protein
MSSEKHPLRCPMGVPGGIIAALTGLTGIIISAMNSEWLTLALSFGLLMVALPFIRVTMMVHSANDRLDVLEKNQGSK